MNTLQHSSILALLACVLVACTGDGDKPQKPAPGSEPTPAAEEAEPGSDTDNSAEPGSDSSPEPAGPVPLTAWVDSMYEQGTMPDAVPDTVLDKNVSDETDPYAFDKFLQ